MMKRIIVKIILHTLMGATKRAGSFSTVETEFVQFA